MGNTTITGFANVTTSVNSALLTVGSTFIANTSQLTTTVPFSANGATGTAGHVLTSNGATGSPYWAAAAGGGYYKGGTSAVGSLAVGGQNLFRVNANTLNTSTTFVAGENGSATGPITIASGITLTIQTGARVSIV
jgi:ABC-type cobalamin transport system ATPase subunit